MPRVRPKHGGSEVQVCSGRALGRDFDDQSDNFVAGKGQDVNSGRNGKERRSESTHRKLPDVRIGTVRIIRVRYTQSA